MRLIPSSAPATLVVSFSFFCPAWACLLVLLPGYLLASANPATNQPLALKKEGDKPQIGSLPRGAIHRQGAPTFRHAGSVNALRFTPDGRCLISGGADGLKVWDAKTGTVVAELASFGGPVYSVACDEKPSRVAAGTLGEVFVFCFHSGDLLLRAKDIPTWVTAVGFSNDGSHVAAGSNRPLDVAVWEVRSGAVVARYRTHMDSRSLALSPARIGPRQTAFFYEDGALMMGRLGPGFVATPLGDRRRISILGATASETRVFASSEVTGTEFFDANTGKKAGSLQAGSQTAAMSDDGRLVALAGSDWKISVYATDSGDQKASFDSWGNVQALAFSADGRKLAAGSLAGVIRVWDLETKKEVAAAPGFFDGKPQAAFPAANLMVSANPWGEAVYLIDLANKRETTIPAGPGGLWCLSPSGDLLAIARKGTLSIRHATTGKLKQQIQFEGGAYHLAISEDSKRVALVHEGGKTATVWEVGKEAPVCQVALDTELEYPCFSPDARLVFLAARDRGRVLMLDVATAQIAGRFAFDRELANPIYSVAAYKGSKVLLSYFGGVILLDLSTGEIEKELSRALNRPCYIGVSPDRSVIALGVKNTGAVELRDGISLKLLGTVDAHRGGVTYVNFSRSGERMATGGLDNQVIAWDVNELKRSLAPPGRTLSRAALKYRGEIEDDHLFGPCLLLPDLDFLRSQPAGCERRRHRPR